MAEVRTVGAYRGAGVGSVIAQPAPESATLVGVSGAAACGGVSVTTEVNQTLGTQLATGAAGFSTTQGQGTALAPGSEATGGVGISGATVGASVVLGGFGTVASVGAASGTVEIDAVVTGFGQAAGLGSVAVQTGAGAALTGFAATAGQGALDLKLGAGAYPLGFLATSALGSELTIVGMRVTLPGFEGDISLGVETAEADANAPVTGFGTTAALGSLTFKLGAGALATQEALLGQIGSPDARLVSHIYITGALGGTAASGAVTTVAEAVVALAGFEADASLGSVATVAKATAPVTGLGAAASVGAVGFFVGMHAYPTQGAIAAGLGAPSETGLANVALSGFVGDAEVGALTAGGTCQALPTGVFATASHGSLVLHGEGSATITGFLGSVFMGLLHQESRRTVELPGFEADAQQGAELVVVAQQAYPTGVQATASSGAVITKVPMRVHPDGHQAVAYNHSVNVNIGIGKYFLWANDLYVAGQTLPKPALHQNHHVEGFDIDWFGPDIGEPQLNGLIGLQAMGLSVGSPDITFQETNKRVRALTLSPESPQLGKPRMRQHGPLPIYARDLVVDHPELGKPVLRTRKRIPPRGSEQQANPGANLLYRGATALERSMADADAERLVDCEAEAIIDVWNPANIAWYNLPFLAWGMSVNLWEPGWPTDVKREWTSRQWTFKELRGKESGIRMALDFAGRGFTESGGGYALKQVVTPPQGFFASRDMTKDEWDDWIHLMPELRIKLDQGHGEADPDEWFADDEFGRFSGGFVSPNVVYPEHPPGPFPHPPVPDPYLLPGGSFIGLDDGPTMYGRRAVLRWHGVDTPMQMTTTEKITYEGKVVEVERVSVLGHARDAFFFDFDYIGEQFICADQQAPKLYTWRLESGYQHSSTVLGLSMVKPDMVVMDPRYERDSDIGYGDNLLFADDWFVGYYGWLEREYADEMLADRIFLYDESVAVPMTIGASFVGVDRIGMAPYHAELMIDLRTKEKLPGHFVDAEDSFLGEVFVLPEDPSHIERACRAVVAGKALRDKIDVDFAVWRQIDPMDFVTETTTAGDFVRASL